VYTVVDPEFFLQFVNQMRSVFLIIFFLPDLHLSNFLFFLSIKVSSRQRCLLIGIRGHLFSFVKTFEFVHLSRTRYDEKKNEIVSDAKMACLHFVIAL